MMPPAYRAAGLHEILKAEPSPEQLEWLFQCHLNFDNATCIVLEQDGKVAGFLMAAIMEQPFVKVRIAKDTCWWVEPSHRGYIFACNDMLNKYEQWAASCGCAFAGLAGMGSAPRVGKLYARRGYAVAETHYLKSLID